DPGAKRRLVDDLDVEHTGPDTFAARLRRIALAGVRRGPERDVRRGVAHDLEQRRLPREFGPMALSIRWLDVKHRIWVQRRFEGIPVHARLRFTSAATLSISLTVIP